LRLVASVEERSLSERLAGSVSEQLGLFADRMREGLLAASVAIGLEVMGELVEAEVSELAGPKGKHDPDRAAYRHGSEAGRVTLGGRRVPVRRPRVRRSLKVTAASVRFRVPVVGEVDG
jgi:putative transposase